ncbi:hypothetical protein GCM10011511_54760 [Puia dinghuensis]|uniref:Uncharacterized protein n=1 Tax=Puia dinghuensis TaxID=1792502 RepID=A0A8J2UJ85_9BACT|nr:hypothetical protein GCM10011511_54760 [Puia dinghuensis]
MMSHYNTIPSIRILPLVLRLPRRITLRLLISLQLILESFRRIERRRRQLDIKSANGLASSVCVAAAAAKHMEDETKKGKDDKGQAKEEISLLPGDD